MDGVDERSYWVYRVLTMLALVLVLVTIGVWADTQQHPWRTTCFDVPLVPEQSLQVCMWRGTMAPNRDAGPFYPMMRITVPVRRVGLWYQPRAGELPNYLMAFPLPIWPLATLTIGVGALAWGLDLRHRGKRQSGK
jgi:hypothetical protein